MAIAEQPTTADILEVFNPITAEKIGDLPIATQADVHAAAQRARDAQPAWEALGVKGRSALLRKWINAVWDDQQNLFDIIRRETGKAEGGAFTELGVLDLLTGYLTHRAPAALRPKNRKPLIPFIQRSKVTYKPHGVVGFITPWNYPLLNGIGDAIPALIAGNTVIVKPSEITPYTALYAFEMMHKAGIPADVAQIIIGKGDTGAALIDEVDYVSFTGSTATGRKIAARCAERLIPYTLELGGKDPGIVLRDADLDQAAAGVLIGAWENAGQVCISTERLYVDRAIYPQFLEKVLTQAQNFKYSPDAGFDVDMGSLTNEREVLRAEAHIADAVAKGAQVVYGGKRRPDLGAYFFEPTILTGVTHDMDVMTEETFAPILPIMQFETEAEAVRLANDSEYGLSASIFTEDHKRGEKIASQLVCGDVVINRPMLAFGTPSTPMGGRKNSGIGRRNGIEGLMRFVVTQSILVDTRMGMDASLNQWDPLTMRFAKLAHQLRKYLPFI